MDHNVVKNRMDILRVMCQETERVAAPLRRPGSEYEDDCDDYEFEEPCIRCEDCGDVLSLGSVGVTLRLVYPAQRDGTFLELLDALDEEGNYLAEPHTLCTSCWEDYEEELESHRDSLFLSATPPTNPSPVSCVHCCTPIEWGTCTGYAQQGVVALHETGEPRLVQDNELGSICIACIEVLNDECASSIWAHLWEGA